MMTACDVKGVSAGNEASKASPFLSLEPEKRLLPTLHSALKNQCVRYPSGSAHVAAGLSESADPRSGVRGCEKGTVVKEP